MNQVELQNLIRREFAEKQAKNSSYSMRSFAKKLGIGFGTLSQVLSGKRSLSQKLTLKVLAEICASPKDRAKVLKGQKVKSSFEYSMLAADQYFVLSEWYYLAILSMVRTSNFKADVAHAHLDISERLGISTALSKQALERLERLNLLKQVSGKYVRTQVALTTSDEVSSAAVKKSHAINLELASKALDEQDLTTRDFTWLTFAFDPKDMSEAKQKIREFQDEFSNQFSTSKQSTEVYRLAMQLFSLTKTKNKK